MAGNEKGQENLGYIKDNPDNIDDLAKKYEPSAPSSENVDNFQLQKKDIDEEEAEEEEDDRPQWSNHMEFILSVIGYAVGLGNVWRFPYQCYKNGGGAFLVVYWMLSACVGFPLILLEQSLGQYTSQSPMHAYVYAPIVRGIGWAMAALSMLACIYYNVIITWSLFMLFASFQAVLPFKYCDYTSWATFRCEMKKAICNDTIEVRATDGLCYNNTYLTDLDTSQRTFEECYTNSTEYCFHFANNQVANVYRNQSTILGYWNESIAHDNDVSPRLSTDEYFNHYVLGLWPEYNTENIGAPSWGLALCLLLAWVLVYICLFNGIKSAGKVVWFTALFPYVILFILIGRGVTLPGAYDGLMFYLTPDFEKVKQPGVWFAAANQLFFSLSCGWGGMIALSSYNNFDNNVLRDTVITVIADSLTSFTAGFAIFSVIGYGAHLLDKPIDQVAKAGTGLAFIMYPKILMELPGSVAWAIAFFFMLLLLGLDSEFNTMETVLTVLFDAFPYFRSTMLRKAAFLAVVCTVLFCFGLPMICNGGSYLVDVTDSYSSGWGALLIGVMETLSLAWLYGTGKYHLDLKLMIQRGWSDIGRWYLFAFWGIISPGIILLILAYSFATYTRMEGITPTDEVLGWCCTIFVLIWPPVLAVYEVVTAHGDTFFQKLKSACTPAKEWGPYLVKNRRLVTHLGPDFDIDPRGKLKRRKKKKEAEKAKADQTETSFSNTGGDDPQKF